MKLNFRDWGSGLGGSVIKAWGSGLASLQFLELMKLITLGFGGPGLGV